VRTVPLYIVLFIATTFTAACSLTVDTELPALPAPCTEDGDCTTGPTCLDGFCATDGEGQDLSDTGAEPTTEDVRAASDADHAVQTDPVEDLPEPLDADLPLDAGDGGTTGTASQRWHAEAESNDVTASTGQPEADNYNLWSDGELRYTVTLPADGSYVVRARLWADQCCGELARAALHADDATLWSGDVAASRSDEAVVMEASVTLAAGEHQVAVAFLNDRFDRPTRTDRNLHVDWVEVEGPMP